MWNFCFWFEESWIDNNTLYFICFDIYNFNILAIFSGTQFFWFEYVKDVWYHIISPWHTYWFKVEVKKRKEAATFVVGRNANKTWRIEGTVLKKEQMTNMVIINYFLSQWEEYFWRCQLRECPGFLSLYLILFE